VTMSSSDGACTHASLYSAGKVARSCTCVQKTVANERHHVTLNVTGDSQYSLDRSLSSWGALGLKSDNVAAQSMRMLVTGFVGGGGLEGPGPAARGIAACLQSL